MAAPRAEPDVASPPRERILAAARELFYQRGIHAVGVDAIAETAGSFSTEFPGQRVDYIFTFGIDAARLKQACVVYDEPAKIASDHYPVFLEV